MSHPPRNRRPPKRFQAIGSSSKSDDSEVSGLIITGTATWPLLSAAASSRATSVSCCSSPVPSPVPSSVPLPQKQVEGSCDLAQELSDWEKFDLHYNVATKNLQEVLGKYSVCNVKFT